MASVIVCFEAEPVIELPVRVYPDVVYVAEDPDPSIAEVVRKAKDRQSGVRVLGVAIEPITQRSLPAY